MRTIDEVSARARARPRRDRAQGVADPAFRDACNVTILREAREFAASDIKAGGRHQR
jgi:hypothetical protein